MINKINNIDFLNSGCLLQLIQLSTTLKQYSLSEFSAISVIFSSFYGEVLVSLVFRLCKMWLFSTPFPWYSKMVCIDVADMAENILLCCWKKTAKSFDFALVWSSWKSRKGIKWKERCMKLLIYAIKWNHMIAINAKTFWSTLKNNSMNVFLFERFLYNQWYF